MSKPLPRVPSRHLEAVLDIWSEQKKETRLRISGECMSPLIRDNDVLTLVHGSRDLRFGDIVAYGEVTRPAVHRVIHIAERDGMKYLVLKPDRYHSVCLIAQAHVLGRVAAIDGSNGRIHLDSIHGKCLNALLSIHSYVAWRCFCPVDWFWKGICCSIRLQSKILPHRVPWDILIWNTMKRVEKICSSFIHPLGFMLKGGTRDENK